MKNKTKILIRFLIIQSVVLTSTFFLLSPVLAATPSPVVSQNQLSSDSGELEKIQKIKDIVASKVKELNLVEKRGLLGIIRETSNMQIIITDIKGDTRHIDVDELTKFDLGTKSTYGISDLEKGKMYSFVGLYNKDTQKLLARTIDTANTIPAYFEGAVYSVDSKNYQMTLVNEKGVKKDVDIESSTKTSLASDNGDLMRSGFSKLSVNERVLAIGFWDKKDSNLLSALRVIHFSQVPPSKEMQSYISASSSAK